MEKEPDCNIMWQIKNFENTLLIRMTSYFNSASFSSMATKFPCFRAY